MKLDTAQLCPERIRRSGAWIRGAMLLAALGSLAIPSLATASEVGSHRGRLVYTAAAGEANRVLITGGVRAFRVRDPGVMIQAGSGCESEASDIARCQVETISRIVVVTGDGDDSVAVVAAPIPTRIVGGPGNDHLAGGSGPDEIHGSDGDDVLLGRNGTDVLRGGRDADRLDGGDGADVVAGQNGDDLLDGGASGDRLEGGAGYDTARFVTRIAPLNISVDGLPNDGESGEGDNVALTVERVDGGTGDDVLGARTPPRGSHRGSALRGKRGNDVLLGGSGDDLLNGGPGLDMINGGAGADLMSGGADADVLQGGPGPDQVGASDGSADTVDCGEGTDGATLDHLDKPATACETRQQGGAVPGGGTADGSITRAPRARFKHRRGHRVVQIYVASKGTLRLPVDITLKNRRGRRLRHKHVSNVRTNRWVTIQGLSVPKRATVIKVEPG